MLTLPTYGALLLLLVAIEMLKSTLKTRACVGSLAY